MPVRPGEKHFTTSVFILSQEETPRVLLVDHKKLKVWMPPGGHVDPDENPFDGAMREVMEETGIDIRPFIAAPQRISDMVVSFPKPEYLYEELMPAHGDDPEHVHIDCVYIFRIPHQEPQLNAGESHGIRWFTREEALAVALFDDVRDTLKEVM